MKLVHKLGVAIALIISTSSTFASDLSDLSKLLNANSSAGDIANCIIGTSTPTINQIVGIWKSNGPAVNFKSADILKSTGGVVASATIKNQLAPYYTKAGLDKMIITFSADSKFSIKFDKGTLTGSIAKNSDGSFTLKFNAFNKINIGSIPAHINKGTTTLDITFEITKLVDLISKIASQVDNKSIATAVSFLKSYDGIYAGFSLSK